MLDKSELITTRPGKMEDASFIFATWLRGLYHGDSWFKIIPKKIFMENYHRVVEKILSSPGVEVKVACLKDDPDVILGYSVYKEDRLHWIFVKISWRNIGIAKSLAPQNVLTITHLTKVGLNIMRKYPKLIFNPFALY